MSLVYPFGVALLSKLDHKMVASVNVKDQKTRNSLVTELDEYIREVRVFVIVTLPWLLEGSHLLHLLWYPWERKLYQHVTSILTPEVLTIEFCSSDPLTVSLSDINKEPLKDIGKNTLYATNFKHNLLWGRICWLLLKIEINHGR